MKRYLLKNYYPVYKIGPFIDIGIVGSAKFLQIDYCEQNIRLVRRALSEGFTKEEIMLRVELAELLEKGLIGEFQTYSTLSISERHANFFEFLGIEWKDLEEFKEKKILIFGSGAAGATITYLLAQFGYRRIFVVDSDIVEMSDINKTLIFRQPDIKRIKVSALRHCIEQNFGFNIEDIALSPNTLIEISDIIENVAPDLVIKACDPDLSFRYHLNQICFDKMIPFVHMSYSFERLNIGPFFVPGLTKSDNVIDHNFTMMCGKEYTFHNHKKLFSDLLCHPSTSFNINILAAIILKEIIFFHLNRYEYVFSLNREVYFFPLSMKVLYRSLDDL